MRSPGHAKQTADVDVQTAVRPDASKPDKTCHSQFQTEDIPVIDGVHRRGNQFFNTVNLIPMSIAKDGYPNRNLVFYNLLTPLGVEYLCSQANRNTAVQTQFQQKR